MPMQATNFVELVLPMAEESPRAVVLDWYSRLECMIRDYLVSRRLKFRSGPEAEAAIAADAVLGPELAQAIASLRTVRNRVAHGTPPLAPEEAVAFASQALSLIGRLGRAQDAKAT